MIEPPAAGAATLASRLDAVAPLRALADGSLRSLGGIPSSAVGLVALWARRHAARHLLVIATDPETVYADARLWGGEARLGLWPAADTPGFDRIPPSEEVTRRRIATLALLRDGEPALVVASPAGLLRPTLPVSALDATGQLARGQHVGRDAVLRRLVGLGYRRVTAVTAPGEMAVRGGIVDVFGLDRGRPWRAEWFGDEVDEIRAFDVDTQTSVGRLERVRLLPARELDLSPEAVRRALADVAGLEIEGCRPEVREQWREDLAQLELGVYDDGVDLFAPYLNGGASLFDHLGKGALVLVAGGAERARRAALRYLEEIEGLRDQEQARGELPAGARTGPARRGGPRRQPRPRRRPAPRRDRGRRGLRRPRLAGGGAVRRSVGCVRRGARPGAGGGGVLRRGHPPGGEGGRADRRRRAGAGRRRRPRRRHPGGAARGAPGRRR